MKNRTIKGKYGKYIIIYQNDNFVVCKTPRKNQYFIGTERNIYDLYGFPVYDSCLTKEECIKRLKEHKKITAKGYDYFKQGMELRKITKKEFLKMYDEPIKILEEN